MISIFRKEFWESFKSIRAILIFLFFTFVSYKSVVFWKTNPDLVKGFIGSGNSHSIYSGIIVLLTLVFGFLFVFAISHDALSSETELKTIRLLVTKTSRLNIMIGKFLGAYLFWVFTLSISFGIISLYSKSLFFMDYFKLITLLFYIVCLVLFISVMISKTKITMFLGIFLGIVLPILNLFAMFSHKWYLIPFKFILPYYYLSLSWGYMVLIGIGLIFFLISVVILYRRDF